MKRVDAWKLREELREHPAIPSRLRRCGIGRYSTEVKLLTAGEGAWFDGIVQCRSRTCPPCFVARRFRAANEIAHVVTEREHETARQSFLATLTVRHSAGDPVSLTRDVRKVWRRMMQSRRWQTFKREHGVEWIAAEEVTRGEHGWHPHMHVLLMPRKAINTEDVYSAAFDWHGAWSKLVEKYIGRDHVPTREHGCDLQPCDSAAYLTKLGLELADPSAVKGRAPLAMLEHGEVERYLELQLSRTRARDITFSRGLRGIRDAMPEGIEPAELATLTGSEWGRIRYAGWAVPLDIAEAAETPEAARSAIDLALAGKSPRRDTDFAESCARRLADEKNG